MTLKEQLNDAMKAAMKARDDLRLSAVRMVRSAVKNREIDQKKELDDHGVVEVVTTLVKQRRESIRMYQEGNRPELAQKENDELNVLLEFLPKQLTTEEIEKLVSRVVHEIKAQGAKDMGRVMKALTPLTSGKADGKTVSDIVRKQLA
ncbi:MAG: glutamyl-tRNA amidotransferase [Geobacteraceae bacterium GWC2_55_20]|nr:MAG: glutamyl-tRNA amidotransferase [Geobacteraceae bacterium GWC2_55_20]OGU21335.1 MAG: glutamyl-tRNA amidotransferase [Geobacteraceae bacterium GWF2_54_21]HBA72679.1 glutamyl-tRNA amidotransferase [Geobacter sp.]HCE69481.1 glutamyl-tRNA amidotransferase [Geobacter sp.]